LKNRWTGETGEACFLDYNKDTGRLHEVDHHVDFDEEEDTIPFPIEEMKRDF
jgi:hypothetical protein